MRAGSAANARAREPASDSMVAPADEVEASSRGAPQASQNRARGETSWRHRGQIMDGRLLQVACSRASLTKHERLDPSGKIRTIPVRRESPMPRVLVVHGAGMNMRGKVQVDIFGPMTLPEYDDRIRGYA